MFVSNPAPSDHRQPVQEGTHRPISLPLFRCLFTARFQLGMSPLKNISVVQILSFNTRAPAHSVDDCASVCAHKVNTAWLKKVACFDGVLGAGGVAAGSKCYASLEGDDCFSFFGLGKDLGLGDCWHEMFCVSDFALDALPDLRLGEDWGGAGGVYWGGVGEVEGCHFRFSIASILITSWDGVGRLMLKSIVVSCCGENPSWLREDPSNDEGLFHHDGGISQQ